MISTPWIESHTVLRNHSKVRGAAKDLNISRAQFIGHLHLFWHSVLELAEDGDITNWSAEDIAFYAEWPVDNPVDNLLKSAESFQAILIKYRFIDVRHGKGRKLNKKYVHHWLDYSYKYLYRKYHTQKPELLEIIRNKYKPVGKPKG